MTGVWSQRPDALERDFEFDDFKGAIAFVNRVAEVAEEDNHHPDILVHGVEQGAAHALHALRGRA